MYFYGTERKTDNGNSCLSKIKSFIKEHPIIFYSIIAGIVIVLVVIIVLCVVLTKKDKEEETETEIKIFPLEESLKSKVMEIYNNIGNKDKGTLAQFSSYLSEKASNLKEEQKVYLAYYWIVKNIKYDHTGRAAGTVEYDPANAFTKRTTVCSGYSRLFKALLLAMNYTESKILNIQGYSKGEGYSPFNEPKSDHEWNAVEINGKWCLIDTTWDSTLKTEYYLCTPPRCFVRDHLPDFNNSLQFLKNPISLETFHGLIETREAFCKYNIEIIEDKAIQNICGKGKITVKYKTEKESGRTFLEVSPLVPVRSPANFVTRIDNGFNIDISVNEEGLSRFVLLFNNSAIGTINFKCDKEPKEKFYYPIIFVPYSTSDAELITPIQRNLIRGQKYNFEIRTKEFDELYIYKRTGNVKMTKQGDVFKAENIEAQGNTMSIQANIEDCLLSFYVVDE